MVDFVQSAYTLPKTGVIYAGGTFGCHGTPLSALPANRFLPAFLPHLPQQFCVLENDIVKDSSAFGTDDFLKFYHLIYEAHTQGYDKILLITGTDTLAYLSAFLHFALRGLSISVVLTASMYAFFEPTITPLIPNPKSDAPNNLALAVDFLNKAAHPTKAHHGVFVAVSGQLFYGHQLQKIHTSAINAFAGKTFNGESSTPPINHNPISILNSHICIHSIFCMPNPVNLLEQHLSALCHQEPTAVILIGFGAGNTPYSDALKASLQTLIAQGFLVVIASSCPYGAVSQAYEAGWHHFVGAVSDDLPLPALYAKALWLCLSQPPHNRRTLWQQLSEHL